MIGIVSTLPKREILTSSLGNDDEWHAHYPTALKTLCGLDVPDVRNGRRWPPTCGVCGKTARAFDRIDASMPARWRVTAEAA